MTIIVEDGSGVALANSYITVGQLDAYAAARGEVLPVDLADKELLIIKATDYLETLSYVGQKATYEQVLQWPRTGAVVDGYYLASDQIPVRLLNAQCQLALDARTVDLLPPASVPSDVGPVIEKRVEGAVSVKYAAPVATGGSSAGAALPKAEALLRPLLNPAWGSVRVRRA